MIGLLMPEFVIAKFLRAIINLLRDDLKNNAEEETIVYRLFSMGEDGMELKWNLVDVKKQIRNILLNEQNLQINFGYNPAAANNLALHILLPSENANIGIGADEGYLEEDITDEDGQVIAVRNYFTQMYESTYQIMITGVNGAEVLYTYHLLKSMFLMLNDQLELLGLRLPKLSGNDIVMQDDLAQVPIFHKVLNLTIQYEHNVPQMVVSKIAKNFHFQLHMVEG